LFIRQKKYVGQACPSCAGGVLSKIATVDLIHSEQNFALLSTYRSEKHIEKAEANDDASVNPALPHPQNCNGENKRHLIL
jgi:hypothetical protein